MQDRFKYRIPMFTDKGKFIEYQYLQLGDEIFTTLCGQNGEPEQCTGKKDKNKKLIFEGDIVKTYPSGYFDQDNDIFYIKYNCGGFYLARPYKNMEGIWECNYTIDCYDEKLYEIIGNIHENNKLLGV